jgi:hypothetical protein
MKKFTFSLFALALAFAANAQTVYLNETFQGTFTELNYTVNSSYTPDASEWSCIAYDQGTATIAPTRSLESTPLTYSDAKGEYILSGVGRTCYNNFRQGGSNANFMHLREFSTSGVNKYYASALLQIIAGAGGNVTLLGASQNYNAGAANRPLIQRRKTGSDIVFYTSTNSTTGGSTSSAFTTENTLPQTYFVVWEVDANVSTVKLYINPEIGGTQPDSPDISDNQENMSKNQKFLYLRSNGNTNCYFNISGIRISSTWADAVAAKLTAPTLPASATEQATDLLPDGTGFTANWTPDATDLRADGYDVNVYQETSLIKTVHAANQATSSVAITGLGEGTYTYEVIATLSDGTYSNSDPALSAASTRSADVVLQGTGIGSSVYGKTVQSVQYTTLTGAPAPASAKGVLLKKTIYADGSAKMEKTVK